MYPNKPPEENPDNCVKRGSEACPYLRFSGGMCNTQPCDDGQEATILAGTTDYVVCEEMKDG